MNPSFPILAYELLQNIANIDVCVDKRYDDIYIYIVRENFVEDKMSRIRLIDSYINFLYILSLTNF